MTWTEIFQQLAGILNYPLFQLDGNNISFGKLLTGIVLLVIGYTASKRASHLVDDRVLQRMSLDSSLRYSLRKFIFYFFFFLSTLFILRALNVPITIFTVIGGALAVGIGFGSQNLVNNFISGVLVMMERPVRVGDFIEVDGVVGCVQSIGIRSTIVRTLQNVVTIIPNTALIEKNLTNWTASKQLTSTVRIGVAYGTDLKRLEDICLQAAGEIDKIYKNPAPTLLFQDFGDNALILDLVFNIDSASFPLRRSVESQVRFRLNELFVQNQIDIPFPQRDIRLKLPPNIDLGAMVNQSQKADGYKI